MTTTLGRKALLSGLGLCIAAVLAFGTSNASAFEHRGGHSSGRTYSYNNHYYGGHNWGGNYWGGRRYNNGFGLYYGNNYGYRYPYYDSYYSSPQVWVDGYYETVFINGRYVQIWHPGYYRYY